METIRVNETEYRVISLLGRGKGGYSYRVTDGTREFTLKQIHHEPCDYYQFGNKLESELQDYATLSALGLSLPRLLAVDHANERLVKEFIDGPTICQLVEQDAMEEDYFRQMEAMCRALYENGLNIDYFPTNFVVQQGKLYYIDYECNPYDPQWDFAHWGIKYWSKTPEFLAYLETR